jgi:hypothetical protein
MYYRHPVDSKHSLSKLLNQLKGEQCTATTDAVFLSLWIYIFFISPSRHSKLHLSLAINTGNKTLHLTSAYSIVNPSCTRQGNVLTLLRYHLCVHRTWSVLAICHHLRDEWTYKGILKVSVLELLHLRMKETAWIYINNDNNIVGWVRQLWGYVNLH